MQAQTQNMSLLFASAIPAQGGASALGTGSQAYDSLDENGQSSFLQSLQGLVSELKLAGQESEAGALSSAIEQLITDQAANNDLHLPLTEGQALAAQVQVDATNIPAFPLSQTQGESTIALGSSISIEALLQQIQQGFTNSTAQLDPDLQARLVALTSSQATTAEVGNIFQSGSQANALDLMKQAGNLNHIQFQANSVDLMAQAGSLNQPLAVNAMDLQKQIKLGESKLLNDAEITPLLNREATLSTNTTAMLNPVLMERALLNMNQAGRQAAPEMLSGTDVPLESLTSMQSGSLNRSSVQTSIAETRPQQTMIQVPLTDPQWQTDFSNRIVMLAKGAGAGQAQVAEIRLNPAHMGPIEVRVVMNDDQASVTFTAQHSAVRDAIDTSLPRLREMFTSSGLLLSDAEVSDQSLHDRRQNNNQDLADSGHQHSDSEFHLDAESDQPIAQMDLSHLAASSALDLYA